MAKNIVVLSDGTGQEGGKGHDTNVYKLMRMLEDRTERQIVFYDQGIGTDGRTVTGNVAGAGFSENILQCYHFIYENYNAGDKIYLLGFSRGAATVRSLANFIHYFGILPKSRPGLIQEAYDIYKMGRAEGNGEPEETSDMPLLAGASQIANAVSETISRGETLNEKAKQFVHAHPNQWASIEFLGVWDTVPALGFPAAVIDTFINFVPSWKHRYHDFRLHPSVKNAYQALSIDDDRKWFQPTIWDDYNEKYQKVEQVWFSGAHTDIGGGFYEAGLSDIALEWMVQKAVSHGIKLYMRSIKYWNFCIAPDATDDVHPPRKGAGRIYPYQQRLWPASAKEKFGVPTVHQSVLDRAKRLPDYQPWILKAFPECNVEPWVETFEYEGTQMSIRDYDEVTNTDKFVLEDETVKILKPENYYDNLLTRGSWGSERIKRDLKRWRKQHR